MKKSIPNCIPAVTGKETANLIECINTGWISSVGPFVDKMEEVFAQYHGVESAAAVSSGTAAIHLGLVALGVRKDDLVICPTVTFIGSVNPIRICGADPLFVGVDPNTLNIDISSLSCLLKEETEQYGDSLIYRKNGRRIKAIIVTHLYGNPAEMEPILALARNYKLPILEDAAESLGARYKGRLVGTIGDIGCFSFNGNKVITTGGGGMVVARDSSLVRLCKHLSTQAKVDQFEFIHDAVGFNYRMSNLCAAVGVAQMEKLNVFIEKKRAHAQLYTTLFGNNGPVSVVQEPEGCLGTYWMVVGRLNNALKIKGDIIDRLKAIVRNGIGVRPIWYPIHQMNLYAEAETFDVEKSEQLYQAMFCLPSSVGISEGEIRAVVEEVQRMFK